MSLSFAATSFSLSPSFFFRFLSLSLLPFSHAVLRPEITLSPSLHPSIHSSLLLLRPACLHACLRLMPLPLRLTSSFTRISLSISLARGLQSWQASATQGVSERSRGDEEFESRFPGEARERVRGAKQGRERTCHFALNFLFPGTDSRRTKPSTRGISVKRTSLRASQGERRTASYSSALVLLRLRRESGDWHDVPAKLPSRNRLSLSSVSFCTKRG